MDVGGMVDPTEKAILKFILIFRSEDSDKYDIHLFLHCKILIK